MKKRIKLTENQLYRLIRQTINEATSRRKPINPLARRVTEGVIRKLNEGWSFANLGEYYHPDSITDIIDYYDDASYGEDEELSKDILEILEKLPPEEKAPYIDDIYEEYEDYDEHLERPQTFREAMKEFVLSPYDVFYTIDFRGSSALADDIYQKLINDYGYERFHKD